MRRIKFLIFIDQRLILTITQQQKLSIVAVVVSNRQKEGNIYQNHVKNRRRHHTSLRDFVNRVTH